MLARFTHRCGRRRADDGFTLLELSVAAFIILGLITALLPLYVSAKTTIVEAKQRQSATALGNQVMEQLRALPYELVTAGLNSGDLAGDPNIVSGRFKPAYDNSIDEPIPVNSTVNIPPLYPHRATTTVTGVTYNVGTYVTSVTASDPEQFFLTVIVEWASAATANETKNVVSRSKLFSPQGCSTATRVYSGPCQAYLYGSSGTTPGSITVRPVTDGGPVLGSVDLVQASVALPGTTAGFQAEQTVGASGQAVTSGVQVETSAGTTAAGQLAATSGVDTDPALDTPTYIAASTPGQTDGPLTAASADGTTFSFRAGASDAGTTTSSVAAETAHACTDFTGTALNTSQPCSSGKTQLTGTSAEAGLRLKTVGTRTLSMSLGSLGQPAQETRALAARFIAPGTGHCLTASGAGCSASAVTRSMGPIVLGGLPSLVSDDVAPAGFGSSVVSLTGYKDLAHVEASAGGPTSVETEITSGTLTYWNGNGYTTEDLTSALAGPRTVPDVTAVYKTGADDVTITVSTILDVAGPASPATATGAGPCAAACTSEASIDSPISVVQTYTVHVGSSLLGTFAVDTGLGRAVASSTFKAAPSA